MKLTENYLRSLIRQALNEMNDDAFPAMKEPHFNPSRPADDYQDLYDQYVPSVLTSGEFNKLINDLNDLRPSLKKIGQDPERLLRNWLTNMENDRRPTYEDEHSGYDY